MASLDEDDMYEHITWKAWLRIKREDKDGMLNQLKEAGIPEETALIMIMLSRIENELERIGNILEAKY